MVFVCRAQKEQFSTKTANALSSILPALLSMIKLEIVLAATLAIQLVVEFVWSATLLKTGIPTVKNSCKVSVLPAAIVTLSIIWEDANRSALSAILMIKSLDPAFPAMVALCWLLQFASRNKKV